MEIRLADGMTYLEKRRAAGAAEGTIERECATLMAVMNLAVDEHVVDKNRLRRLPIPQYEAWELRKIRATAPSVVWRLVLLALQLGLRENKLIELHEEWLLERGDGW